MTFRSFLSRATFFAFPVPMALVAAGCGADGGTTGALEQSTTRPDCAPEDAACQSDGLDAPVAIGARLPLDLHITARGVAAPRMTLESARSSVLLVDGVTLIGKSPGWSSVVMLNEGGLVLDFLTMSVAAPDRVELYRLTDGGAAEAAPMPAKIQVAVGDDFEVSVKPWAGATRLLGNIDAVWTVSAPDVATLLDSGRPATRRLRVKAPGSLTLTIESPAAPPGESGGPVAAERQPGSAAPFTFKKTLEVEVLQ